MHPERNERTKENDIAVVILTMKPPYTGKMNGRGFDWTQEIIQKNSYFLADFIRPICLPDVSEIDASNDTLFVAGFGWTVGCE